MILNCFISNLIPEICHEIVVLQHTSISQALGLAKLLESKINDSKCYSRNPYILPKPSTDLLPPQKLIFPSNQPPTLPLSPPIKKLTST